jgi:hypothetical protein
VNLSVTDQLHAREIQARIGDSYLCDWIDPRRSGMRGWVFRIAKNGSTVLTIDKSTRKWGIYGPGEPEAIKEAPQIKDLTYAVIDALGIPKP